MLLPVSGNETKPDANAQVTIRQTSGLDMFQVTGRKLVLNGTYTVSARCHTCDDDEDSRTPLVSFNASMPTATDCGSAPQALAFFKFFNVHDMIGFGQGETSIKTISAHWTETASILQFAQGILNVDPNSSARPCLDVAR
ncbi:hypothetical protein AC578_1625 [Pseudocercospora eumusae]|uniref:Uncharacterized protein n=1 Tax=Pseudocercospora eumusae TaxID=321146 RepID=A0A139HM18_9PEZI|nr:hypothetical protein AC578_1625 [Pseudocercospora eumusae]